MLYFYKYAWFLEEVFIARLNEREIHFRIYTDKAASSSTGAYTGLILSLSKMTYPLNKLVRMRDLVPSSRGICTDNGT